MKTYAEQLTNEQTFGLVHANEWQGGARRQRCFFGQKRKTKSSFRGKFFSEKSWSKIGICSVSLQWIIDDRCCCCLVDPLVNIGRRRGKNCFCTTMWNSNFILPWVSFRYDKERDFRLSVCRTRERRIRSRSAKNWDKEQKSVDERVFCSDESWWNVSDDFLPFAIERWTRTRSKNRLGRVKYKPGVIPRCPWETHTDRRERKRKKR